MQATGLGPPALGLKSMVTPRAEAYPDQDRFLSLLQQRMVARTVTGDTSTSQASNRGTTSSQLRRARAASSTSPLLSRSQNKRRGGSDSIVQALANRDRQKCGHINSPYDEASTPIDTKKSTSSTSKKFSSPELTATLRGKVSRLLQGNAQAVDPPTLPSTEMPATLKALVDFLNQEPNQALKVPNNRLPQVESFLMEAGLPAAQVESLINSPSFQDQGLTAQNVQAAWQNAVKNSLEQAVGANGEQIAASLGKGALQKTLKSASQIVTLQNIANQPEYREMWQSLTLPQQDLAALRTELQKLGVPPESLTGLNQQNFPSGISLDKVWQYLQQASTSDATAASKLADAAPLVGGNQSVAAWRQLLMDAGMSSELAQTMIPDSATATKGDLRTTLMQVAPQAATQQTETPKPLYLPINLRVRQVPRIQQTGAGQEQGGATGNFSLTQGLNPVDKQPQATSTSATAVQEDLRAPYLVSVQQADAGQGQSSGDANANLAQNFSFSSRQQGANTPAPATADITENLNNFLAMLNAGGQAATGQTGSSGVAGVPFTSVNAYLTPEAKEAVWTQLQSGILGNLRPGANQVSMTLDPPALGKVDLTLNVKGGAVEVTAVASHAAVAEAAVTGVQQLEQALTQQGFTLTQFNFHHQEGTSQDQAQLAFSHNQGGNRQQAGNNETGNWDSPATPQQRRGNSGIDCFA